MVKRNAKSNDQEPEQMKFELPSEKEHLFQVVDVYDQSNAPGNMSLDNDTVCAKLEVVGGEEEGRTTLARLSLDDTWKGFFATRLFLKAISEPYKGEDFEIDTDRWQGKQFYATIKHSEYKDRKYANINAYNYEKIVEQTAIIDAPTSEEEIAWDEEK